MMCTENRLLRRVFRIIALLLMLLILLPAVPAYALDSNYIISEYNGWLDIDERIDFEKRNAGFDGFLKRIADEENGCFYMYFSFYDVGLEGYDDDNTVISFDIHNSMNSYRISVNRNGFVNTGADEQRNIKLIYNFDNCSGNRRGGEVFIGFELINNVDREQYNYISCEYAGGGSETSVLFENYLLDMYVEPIASESTDKPLKGDKSTTKHKSVSDKSRTTQNTGKTESVSEKSTKYSPTGTVSRNAKKEQYSKFSAGNVYSSSIDNNETEEEKTVLNEAENTVGVYRMSKTAVIVLSVAGIMIVSGIAFVVAGIAVKSKKKESDDNSEIESE